MPPIGKTIDQLPEKTTSVVNADKLLITDSVDSSSKFVTGDKLPSGVAANWKADVRLASTANGVLATDFEIGDVLDGETLAAGNRFLLKNQTTPSENGIYTPNASGAPSRASDLASGASAAGTSVIVTEGTTNADTVWLCTTNEPNDIVGTDGLVFGPWPSSGGGSGDVVGPSNALDNAFPRFDGTTGKLIQGGQTIEDDSGNVVVAGAVTGELAVYVGASGSTTVRPLQFFESVIPGGEGVRVGGPQLIGLDVSGTVEICYRPENATTTIPLTGPQAVEHLDGDHLDVSWAPSNYTPAATPAEAADVNDLTAHLYGIDQALGSAGDVSGPASSTDRALAIYSGTTGKVVQDSTLLVTSAGYLGSTAGDLTIDLPGSTDTLTFLKPGAGFTGYAMELMQGTTRLWGYESGNGVKIHSSRKYGFIGDATAFARWGGAAALYDRDGYLSLAARRTATPATDDVSMQVAAYDGSAWAMKQVTQGATDSAGTGFRTLKVPN